VPLNQSPSPFVLAATDPAGAERAARVRLLNKFGLNHARFGTEFLSQFYCTFFGIAATKELRLL